MKKGFNYILVIFFLALSLWLSFKVKNQRQELFQLKTTQYDAELLLVSPTGLITGLLPLEAMKEEALFSGLPVLKKIGFD